MEARVLVVDDEKSMCDFLEIMLKKEGYQVRTTTDPREALELVEKEPFHLVLTDVRMPEIDGFQVLRRVKEVQPETLVIMITAYGSPEGAVEAMKQGAYDYITKPFRVDEVKLVIRKALERYRLWEENIRLRQEVEGRYRFWNIIGKSPRMQQVFDLIEKVSQTKVNVLIVGESGTGKELVAKAIHYNSPRKGRPFVALNCAAIPETLLESELFGYVKGAFTGAATTKKGMLEVADGGTLFFDEVGDLPPLLQAKLLRVIQEREFKRLGGTSDIKVDLRIIAATNQNLEEKVKKKEFREDLYYRLNVIQIKLPPLRERKEDIPLLAQHFLAKYSRELGKKMDGFTPEAMELLLQYDYPGNVRELENILERCITLEPGPLITERYIRSYLAEAPLSPYRPSVEVEIPEEGVDLERIIEEMEKAYLRKALEKAGGGEEEGRRALGDELQGHPLQIGQIRPLTSKAHLEDRCSHQGYDEVVIEPEGEGLRQGGYEGP